MIGVLVSENVFEGGHFVFAVSQDHAYLCRSFLVGRIPHFTGKAWPKLYLIRKDGMALEASLRKDLLAGLDGLLCRASARLSNGRQKYGSE